MAAKFTCIPWTNQEVQILREKYPVSKVVAILPLLPNHTKIAIRIKARRLGMKKVE
jgi:hypothetical protein